MPGRKISRRIPLRCSVPPARPESGVPNRRPSCRGVWRWPSGRMHRAKDWRGAVSSALAGTLFLSSFGAEYYFLIRHIPIDHFLKFWAQDLMPFPRPPSGTCCGLRDVHRPVPLPDGIDACGDGSVSFLCGTTSLFKRNPDTLCILFFPAFVTIVASALQRFPLRGRLVLFLHLSCDPHRRGNHEIFEMGRAKRLSAGALFVVLLYLHPLANALVHVRYPEEARASLDHSEEIRRCFSTSGIIGVRGI